MTDREAELIMLACERLMVSGAVRVLERLARSRRAEATKESGAEADRFLDAARAVSELMPKEDPR